MAKTLCAGEYKAQSLPKGLLLLVAWGVHPTGGYTVSLDAIKMPNSYELVHEKPTSPSPDVITPFVVHAHWFAADTPRSVYVRDAGGDHYVPVENIPDANCKGGDGPFPTDDGPAK